MKIFIKMNLIISLMTLALIGQSCSSSADKEKKTIMTQDNSSSIEKDYVVIDASHTEKPIWVTDPGLWLADQKESIIEKEEFRYYTFETDPKIDREVSCDYAKANARAELAANINTFIQKNLTAVKEGEMKGNSSYLKLEEYIETRLAEKIQAMLNGASLAKIYWEKRRYEVNLGAQNDFTGFTCAALIKIHQDDLKFAINKAREDIEKNSESKEVKAKVHEALEKVEADYLKTKQGLL
jgi:hypothetical protein